MPKRNCKGGYTVYYKTRSGRQGAINLPNACSVREAIDNLMVGHMTVASERKLIIQKGKFPKIRKGMKYKRYPSQPRRV